MVLSNTTLFAPLCALTAVTAGTFDVHSAALQLPRAHSWLRVTCTAKFVQPNFVQPEVLKLLYLHLLTESQLQALSRSPRPGPH